MVTINHETANTASGEISSPLLSLVIPVHNQEDHIGAVFDDYVKCLKDLARPFEILPVVNASSDGSEAIVRKAAANNPAIRPVVTTQPGWGNAVLLGIENAAGGTIVYTNSSRTTGDDLLRVCRAHDFEKPVLTKAHRSAGRAALRTLGSGLYNTEARILFGVRSPDVNGTPKIMPRALFDDVQLRETGDFIDLELLHKCRLRGIPVVNVPIESTRRLGGRSTTGLKTAGRLLSGALVRRITWTA